jgi:hypothetical protein
MHHVDDPERMTPEERATEVASILAAGILRLQGHSARPNGPDVAENRAEKTSETLPELP